MGEKCLWKTCMFLQREIIIHTMGFATKEAFHFKLQGRCWFPKSYWLKMAQLRSARGAMNGDSGFSLPLLSSCELYCCLALKGGKRAVPAYGVFHGDLRYSAVTPICAWAYSLERFHLKRQMKTSVLSLCTFCTHAPVCTNCHHWYSQPSGFISWTWNHWHRLNKW